MALIVLINIVGAVVALVGLSALMALPAIAIAHFGWGHYRPMSWVPSGVTAIERDHSRIPWSFGAGLVGTAERGPIRLPEIDPPESFFLGRADR